MTKDIRKAVERLDDVRLAWIFVALAVTAFCEAAGPSLEKHKWLYLDWSQLFALGFAALAVTVAAMTVKKEMNKLFQLVLVMSVLLFALDKFVENGSRFPGAHTSWLWLMLAVFTATMWFVVASDNDPESTPEEARLFYEPLAARLRMPVTLAMIVFGVGLIAVIHSWAVVDPLLITEVPLCILLVGLIKAAPRETVGQSVTT